jgi:hypothetical protein
MIARGLSPEAVRAPGGADLLELGSVYLVQFFVDLCDRGEQIVAPLGVRLRPRRAAHVVAGTERAKLDEHVLPLLPPLLDFVFAHDAEPPIRSGWIPPSCATTP